MITSDVIETIQHVEFGILDHDLAQRMSVATIESSNFNTNQNGVSANGSICDPRLGTTSQKIKCKHCGQGPLKCSGHMGIINLVKPVFHPYFVDSTLKLLKVVCFWCSHPLLHKNVNLNARTCKSKIQSCLNLVQNSKMEKIGDTKVLMCPNCKGPQPTYTKTGMVIHASFPTVDFGDDDVMTSIKTLEFDATTVLQILSSIPKHFSDMLELPDPQKLLMDFVMVMPNRNRPGMNLGDKKSPDDITVRLLDVIKCNNALKNNETTDAYNDLQHAVGFLLNSEIKATGNVSSQLVRPIKSLIQKLRGKKGILRANATGKRSNFTARSVVTPILCDIDTVCLPKEFMTTLTQPVKVCVKNINELMNCVKRGPNILNGADRIEKHNGSMIFLQHSKNLDRVKLEIGDIVHRYIQAGDYVLLNRQPSLHRYSILAMKVAVSPYAHHTIFC